MAVTSIVTQTSESPDYRNAFGHSDLPFMNALGCWTGHPESDPFDAELQGAEMAAHLVQYVVDNPGYAGDNTLGRLIQSMSQTTDTKHLMVGLFSYLEIVMSELVDRKAVWNHFQQWQAEMRELAMEEAA